MRYLRTSSFNKVKIFWVRNAFVRNTLASVYCRNASNKFPKAQFTGFFKFKILKCIRFDIRRLLLTYYFS